MKIVSYAAFCATMTLTLSVGNAESVKVQVMKSWALTQPGSAMRDVSNAGLRRQRRDAFSSSDQQAILDIHNNVRRLEGASNMELMVGRLYLIYLPADCAAVCDTAHVTDSH